jgi:hypothetical protein
MKMTSGRAMALIALAAMVSQGARAASCAGVVGDICVTDTVTWSGGAPPSGTAVVTDPYGSSASIATYAPTASFFVGDAFNPGPIAQNFPSPGVAAESGGGTGTWNFYDNYVFFLGSGANVGSALISFSNGLTGISDLEARLFQLSPTVTTNGAFDAIAPNQLGNPPANAVAPIVDSWTSGGMNGAGVYQVLLAQHTFGAGEYVLQIRGEVQDGTGAFSGSYGGTLSLTPVPLPASLPLLLGGLGALGGLLRRRVSGA